MKKGSIRILSLFLALVLTVSLIPVSSNAFGYEDIPSPGDPLYVTREEAAQILREQMIQRQETVIVYVRSDQEEDYELFRWIMEAACAHSDTPTGGDYLLWQRQQYGGHIYSMQT